MAGQGRRDLLKRIKDLEDENDDLQSRLDDVADIVATPDEDEGDENGKGED